MSAGWRAVPLWSITHEVRTTIDPADVDGDVFHYSIPVVDETGTGRVESSLDSASSKLLLEAGEVLISKLNPHKGRVLISQRHSLPILASPEFIALRVDDSVVDRRFLASLLASEPTRQYLGANVQSATRSHQRVSPELVRHLNVVLPPVDEQRRIADFLDVELGRIDELMNDRLGVIRLLEERVNSQILDIVGSSRLVDSGGVDVIPIKRLVVKHRRPAKATEDVVTAFRDGQVTTRGIRRADGYTLTESSEPQGQGVEVGDIVIHGLDGFAGAIGDAETAGNCSPVYHICTPIDGGSAPFYGRLLRELALGDYLGLFATSTRERAVDFRNWQLFGAIPIPLVDPSLQHQIGNEIHRIRPLREEVGRFNERLAERRQALITAAVTGEIDVATASGVSA